MTGESPSQHKALTDEFGTPAYARVDAPATRSRKRCSLNFARTGHSDRTCWRADRKADARTRHDAPIGGLKVTTESGWFAARPSGNRGRLQDLCRVLQLRRPPRAHPNEAREVVSDALATIR